MKIGAMELVVIFIVALLVIGPDKLPQYAKKFGAALREFRKASSDVTKEIRESVIDPLAEAQKPLRDAMEPLDDISKGLKGDLNAVEKDLKNIGKARPQEKQAEAEKTPEAPAEENAPAAQSAEPAAPAANAEAAEDKGGESA